MIARTRWLEYSDKHGGCIPFARWCELVVDPVVELELHGRVQAVLDDPELLRAVLAAVEVGELGAEHE
jgi:hypothetical protein